MQINQNERAAERVSGKEKTAVERGIARRQVEETGKVRGEVGKEGNGGLERRGILCVCVFMVDRKKEGEGGGKSDLPAMAGRGMPGPGTAERDGGWSVLTALLPTEHIPTPESWRLFNLQILKLLESFPTASCNNAALILDDVASKKIK